MTATSERITAGRLVAALAFVSAATLAACGSGGGTTAPVAPSSPQAFAWLRPAPAPASWHVRSLPGGAAALAYPPSWSAIRSDPGTVSAAIRNRHGQIKGYLNATPQGGPETLSNWQTFRPDHNRDEGDTNVRATAWASDLRFRTGHGSCVTDDYTSSSGHSYRELACIVAGPHATTVVVGAAPPNHWSSEGPLIERAISSFST